MLRYATPRSPKHDLGPQDLIWQLLDNNREQTPLRVIFLNRFFYPDHSATSRILSDVAFGLAERGFEVCIITSRLRYDALGNSLPSRETVRGVDVHRVWTSSFGRLNLLGRAIDYLTFYISAGWTLWRITHDGAIIVAKTDPPMLSVIAAPIARARRAKLVNWLQDVFPEVAQAIGVGHVPKSAYQVLRHLRNRSLKGASFNVVLGVHMADRLASLGVAASCIRVVANFADGVLIRPIDPSANKQRAAWGFSDKFVVGYSGNFGRAHEHRTLRAAMEQLSGLPTGVTRPSDQLVASTAGDVAWLFVGGGALFGELKRDTALRRLTGVRFEPYQPDAKLAECLSVADVHIVSLRPELEGLIVPSKFYGICAAGRPTIFIGDLDGEIARLLKTHACGFTVAHGDGAGLARAILEFAADPALAQQMGERARSAFDSEFDKSVAVSKWEKLLREIACCPDPHGTHSAQAEYSLPAPWLPKRKYGIR